MSRHAIIVVLVGLNLFLLAGIIFAVGSPPAAMAQRVVGGAANYLVVAAEVQNDYDAIYFFDLPERRLHALAVKRGTNKIQFVDTRDLTLDFRAR